MSNPKLLLLDQPARGIAPLLVRALFQATREINQRRATILLAEQNASQSLHIAGRGYIMEAGQLVFTDPSPRSAWKTRESGKLIWVRKIETGADSRITLAPRQAMACQGGRSLRII